MRAVDQLIGSTPAADLRTYLAWHLVHTNAFILSADFVSENFRFYSATLRGAKENRARWKRCVSYVDGDLGEALGKAFVEGGVRRGSQGRHAAHGARNRGRARTGHQHAHVDDRHDKSAGARQAARRRENKIGYPDQWRNYDALRSSAATRWQLRSARNAFEFKRQMGKIGQAGRQERVGDDAADGERVLRAAGERDRLPGRHPAAAVLRREESIAAVNFGAIGMVDRPRADARLRRRGPAVRRARATCTTGGPPPTRRPSRSARRASRTSTPASPPSTTCSSTASSRSARTSPTTAALRLAVMAYLASTAGEGGPRGSSTASRPSSASFSASRRYGAKAAGPRTSACSRRPTRTRRPLPRERRRVEHAGVPEGVLVQAGRADGARERLPRLVTGGCARDEC